MPVSPLRYLTITCCLLLLAGFQRLAAQQHAETKPVTEKPVDRQTAIDRFNTKFSKNDTIWSAVVIYNGDTIPARTYAVVDVNRYMGRAMRRRVEAMTRLRNAVYVTYPYARKAGIILNDMNSHLARMNSEFEKKEYIKSRETQLKKEFTDPMEKLSVYQGQILMKLINRQTGNNCYDIIKEYAWLLRAGMADRCILFWQQPEAAL